VKQWEIYEWQPPKWDRPHPVVVVSHPDRAARKPHVEVVACSTARANRQPGPTEALLDTADGLAWETICFGDMIYSVDAAALRNRLGEVTRFRRAAIVRAILAGHGWATAF
jgi:mRNA-degrading endonuclease toxin of MazEF toxin-antitoxin module